MRSPAITDEYQGSTVLGPYGASHPPWDTLVARAAHALPTATGTRKRVVAADPAAAPAGLDGGWPRRLGD